MCRATLGQLISIDTDAPLAMGRVALPGGDIRICLAFTPNAQIGDALLVHAGYAMGVLTPTEAEETRALLMEMDRIGGAEGF